MDSDFILTTKKFITRQAVTSSAMRNQGKGVLKAVHAYLDQLELFYAPPNDGGKYRVWLNLQTNALLKEFPTTTKPWGAARKALNLFMRDIFNNRYLNKVYDLDYIEKVLEIPLDSAVAKGLKKEDVKGKLPEWPGLKGLTREISDQYQKAAGALAKKRKIPTVHLDMYLWMENR